MNETTHPHRRIIKSFEAQAYKKRPISVKIADLLTSTFGTMSFLLLNLLIFASWMIFNSGLIPFLTFDPFPYFLLSVAVSTYAILLSIIVLISEKRENQINNLRNELTLQVNLYTEKEIKKILQILRLMLQKQGIKYSDAEFEEMTKEIDTSYIERKLVEQMEKPEGLTSAITKPIEEIEKKVSEKLSQPL